MEQIAQDQRHHIRHEGIDVPPHGNPFLDDNAGEDRFWRILGNVIEESIIPMMWLHPEEWEGGVYPTYEVCGLATEAPKKICISLADVVWEQWAKTVGSSISSSYGLKCKMII